MSAVANFTGTAGWSIPRESACEFPGDGPVLQRYSGVLNCAEINTSFYRSHRVETYAKWARQTPARFRFSVKLPRAITHAAALRGARIPLTEFLSEVAGLGPKLAVLLVQLPASLVYDGRTAYAFFKLLTGLYSGAVVCEPRHPSWFGEAAHRMMLTFQICRAGVDPPPLDGAGQAAGWVARGVNGPAAVVYHRWHGTPRMYWSRYTDDWLAARAAAAHALPADIARWFIFDNTASGAAIANALRFRQLMRRRR